MAFSHQNYQYLTTLLSNLKNPIDITILPDDYAAILWEPPHLGIPKRNLLFAFKVAHSLFFSDAPANVKFNASTILILTVSEHPTAINFRRRYLLGVVGSGGGISDAVSGGENTPSDAERLLSEGMQSMNLLEVSPETELNLTTSFLTSQMAKHNKSPLIWNWRKWLLEKFTGLKLGGNAATTTTGAAAVEDWVQSRVDEAEESEATAKNMSRLKDELKIVRCSGSLHRGNYYAWSYARDLVRSQPCILLSPSREVQFDLQLTYCRTNPSDCGGWSFLSFMSLHCHDDDFREGIITQLLRHAEFLPNNVSSRGNRRERAGEAFWLCVRDIIVGMEDRDKAKEMKQRTWGKVMDGLVKEDQRLEKCIWTPWLSGRALWKEKTMEMTQKRIQARVEETEGEKAVGWLERFWERTQRAEGGELGGGWESRESRESGEKWEGGKGGKR
ncbi:Similar to hypothetical protein AOL_s00080g139 [Arthrobotrys oligospora ATCC 24927]; acc. no. EGX48510 [Pyronema omphalodes CBS 100304]|uniref:Uncharacterized protein n=1 Tax=Pyronema omphalodes (strain CBS 100304) TaxID=1076935 RepID=U4L352_PYROM|nr:Similar to hypothetical protein AOL_s00080g139 [Arthrobotrys oligospora ATCC 24927]; acc. no. EGX48510 [Pyronema omphalodes CBS 100304]